MPKKRTFLRSPISNSNPAPSIIPARGPLKSESAALGGTYKLWPAELCLSDVGVTFPYLLGRRS